ncbi:MAG: hypothetical protein R3D44_00350 [Hyphomicrobiaceae bacterium]
MTVTSGTACRIAGVIVVALALGACSSGSGLTTGSLFGGPSKAAAPALAPETITDRVVYVGTTAARAQRCGYVFDPAALRQSYLSYETQQGATPDAMARAEKSYDYTVLSVTKSIAGDADYCSEEKTSVIKRDLTKVLAGDFSSTTRKPAPNVGWWSPQHSEKPMDREKIFDPRL